MNWCLLFETAQWAILGLLLWKGVRNEVRVENLEAKK